MARAAVTDVISHWHQPFEGLQASPLAFYESVERALAPRQIPHARTERIDWREAGAFSARREYLRVTRARHVIDICGAPFGSGFFASWWLAKVRAPALIPTIVALIATGIIASAASVIGFPFGAIGAWFVVFLVLGLLMSQGEETWHAHLLAIPLLGWLWAKIFLPETYYRMDTAFMFQEAVHAAVMEVIDAMSKAQGLRLLSPLERKPILRELMGR